MRISVDFGARLHKKNDTYNLPSRLHRLQWRPQQGTQPAFRELHLSQALLKERIEAEVLAECEWVAFVRSNRYDSSMTKSDRVM